MISTEGSSVCPICMQKFQYAHWLRTRQFIPTVQKGKIILIDRRVATAQQNKMVDRLGESNKALIQSKNTKQSTNNWLKLVKSWASNNGYENSTKTYYLGVYVTVRTNDGD